MNNKIWLMVCGLILIMSITIFVMVKLSFFGFFLGVFIALDIILINAGCLILIIGFVYDYFIMRRDQKLMEKVNNENN